MRKNKQLEYLPPRTTEGKRVSVLLPILLLIGISLFFVWGAKVKGFQLFNIPPEATPGVETSLGEPETPESDEMTVEIPVVVTPIEDEQQANSIDEALINALANAEGIWAANEWSIDSIEFNAEGDQALIWLAAIDPETKMVRASEPVRAFGTKSLANNSWTIMLEDEPGFAKVLSASDLMDADVVSKSAPSNIIETDVPRIYGGYLLPWKVGLRKALTWSVAHTSCNPTYYCTHAFDFADGTMFELMAAKSGIVYHWKDTCTNGDSTCTNSITLQDRSTTPWTYQVYLHIAKDSIPVALKTLGTAVNQGQLIALVDDTGYSTGHHVHFMVVAQNTLYRTSSGYYFGCAEDITFRDVSINWDEATQGGRPRLAYEAVTYGGEGQTYYISGNAPQNYKLIFPLFFNTPPEQD